MFTKINGTEYTIDTDVAKGLYDDIINKITTLESIDKDILNITIKQLMCHEIAILAHNEIHPELHKAGYLSIAVNLEMLSFEISVGYIEEKLVYGVLVV